MKIFKLILLTAIGVIITMAALAWADVSGAQELAATGQILLAVPAVTLPTQKIVFLTSLKEEYDKIETWLNEAEDLSSFVEQGQTLVFPEAGAEPAVYLNRVTDIDSVEPEETVHKVELDVYDSQNYKLRNIKLHALPFNKMQHYTKKSSEAIVKQEIADAAYAFAPTQAGAKKIIFGSAGPVRNGFKSLTLEDIVKLAIAADKDKFPDGRNLVLPSDMWWDLVNNNPILKGQMERMAMTGVIEPKIVEYYGF
ncbi:MAG: hypothetical protein LBD59_01430, partial [Prevotellaceae bacterium]|nr:hypothetical protein [Prevotellaceae bacterium]